MPLIFWTYTDEGKLDPHSQYQTGSIRDSHFQLAYLQVVPRFSFKNGERFFPGRSIGIILTMGEQPYSVRFNRILIQNVGWANMVTSCRLRQHRQLQIQIATLDLQARAPLQSSLPYLSLSHRSLLV